MKKVALLLLVSSISQAQMVTPLKMGESAPYDGLLFSREAERQLRLMDEQLTVCSKKLTVCDQTLAVQGDLLKATNESVEFYRKEHVDLSRQVIAVQKNSFWRNAFYFTLGAVLTGVVSYGVVQANR